MTRMQLDLNLDHWATNKCHIFCNEGKWWNRCTIELFPQDNTFIWQSKQEDYVAKDWRTITIRLDHAIQLKKNNHFVFSCQRANRGECKHAVCHECYEEHLKAQKRSRGGVLSENELIQSCYMNYTIYSYVLMSGGVPENTWEVPSGQNVPWVVLSVKDVYYGGYIIEVISWGFVCVLCTGLLWFGMRLLLCIHASIYCRPKFLQILKKYILFATKEVLSL